MGLAPSSGAYPRARRFHHGRCRPSTRARSSARFRSKPAVCSAPFLTSRQAAATISVATCRT